MENWTYNATYSGIAQGSGISPVLANIYLNEFDRYMENYKQGFDKGTGRRRNNEYSKRQSYHQRCKDKVRKEWESYSDTEKQEAIRRLADLKRDFQKVPMGEPFDEGYRRIQYVRYADDFLIGVIGSKEDAERIKSDVGKFFKDVLKLELSAEKTLITHSNDKARFLGYDVTVCNDSGTTIFFCRYTRWYRNTTHKSEVSITITVWQAMFPY